MAHGGHPWIQIFTKGPKSTQISKGTDDGGEFSICKMLCSCAKSLSLQASTDTNANGYIQIPFPHRCTASYLSRLACGCLKGRPGCQPTPQGTGVPWGQALLPTMCSLLDIPSPSVLCIGRHMALLPCYTQPPPVHGCPSKVKGHFIDGFCQHLNGKVGLKSPQK